MSITGQFKSCFLRSISALLLFFLPVVMIGGGKDIFAAPAASYQEAIKIIQKHALTLPVNLTGNAASLKKLVQGIDRFSDFLTPEEYAEFLGSQKNNYIGIGAEIEKSKTGGITLLPYSGSPAEKAGVRFGDILVSVNGEPISNKSLFMIGAMTRGNAGTTIEIEVRRTTGKRHKFTITRQQIHTSTVSLRKKDNFWLIKITRFSVSTKRNLKFALEDIDDTLPLIIDVRGNPGGDLNSSIDCAMLFLDKGQNIVEIHRKQGIMKYDSLNASLGLSNPVVIFQDQATASAAEIFTAALCMNHKAVSIGQQTYGKGVVQDIFKLRDGSALFLTTGYLMPPDGKKYHGKGIVADYQLGKKVQTGDYWRQVASLFPDGPLVIPAGHQTPPIVISPHKQKIRINKPGKKSKPAPKTPRKVTRHRKQDQEFYLCVDKNFSTDREAHEWLVQTINRRRIRTRSNMFQRYSTGTISWLACFGPRSTKVSAEKTRRLLTKKIGLPVFIRNFDAAGATDEIVSSKPGETLPPKGRPSPIRIIPGKRSIQQDQQQKSAERNSGRNPSSSWQWYIQAGIFLSADDAVREVEKIRSSNTSLSIKIFNSLSEIQSGSEKQFEGFFSSKEIPVIYNMAFNQRTMIHAYRVVIGPLAEGNNENFLNGLKKRRIIHDDSFLFHFQLANYPTVIAPKAFIDKTYKEFQ